MLVSTLIEKLNNRAFDKALLSLYPSRSVSSCCDRILKLARSFYDYYGDNEVTLFSVPGRTEISGNHTDHSGGLGIAASIDTDIIALATKTSNTTVRIKSDGYREDSVDIASFPEGIERRRSSGSVVYGIAEYFRKLGYDFGGFSAYTESDIMIGSGLSSSAAFEVICAKIFSVLYADNSISTLELAKAGRYAENNFFGKPCGLLDQLACATGGCIYADFRDIEHPQTHTIEFSPEKHGYTLTLINTGGSHSRLIDDFSSVTSDMRSVAALMGKKTLRECSEKEFLGRISYMRSIVGDRAMLRAMHYFDENKRVEEQKKSIVNGSFSRFLELVKESGDSSCKLLENCYTPQKPDDRGISLALALSERFGAVGRVHGGGFAGTIQVFVRTERIAEFRKAIEAVFGEKSCRVCRIRDFGACVIDETGIII